MSDPWTYLANNGPSSGEELPYSVAIRHRRDGVQTFTIHGGSTKAASLPDTPTAVYYIEGKHTPKTVLEAFFEVNPEIYNHTPKNILHWKICGEAPTFKTASRELLGPFESMSERGGDYSADWDCPLCGETVSNQDRPDHLTGHA